MYYSICSDFILCSYINSPYVIVNIINNHHTLVSQNAYSLLLLCDGYFNFDDYELSEDEKSILEGFIAGNLISKSTERLDAPIEFQFKHFDNRFVPSVQWSITPRCNYRCRHCYMDSPVTECYELSTHECFDIIDQMADCGILSVELTGGEAMVRKDFWEIVDYLISKNILLSQVYTNGASLNSSVLDKFEQRGLKPSFSISFDCIGWHDWMRGVKGAEKMALDALKLCADRGFPRNVEMCLFKSNLDAVVDSLELLSTIGVPSVKICPVMDSDLWRKNAEGNELSNEEFNEYVITHMDDFFQRCKGIDILFGGAISISADKKQYSIVNDKNGDEETCSHCYMCNCIRNVLYISPEGRICPCISMASYEDQTIFDKISDHPIKEQLTTGKYIDFVTTRVSQFFDKNSECNSCEYKYRCMGGCRAHALLESNHDLWGIDAYSCSIFRDGYIDRFYEAAQSAWKKVNGVSN